jgi:dynein heavy chain
VGLRNAEQELYRAKEELEVSHRNMQVVEDDIAKLQAQYDGANSNKKQLEAEVQECVKKLDRAQKLLSGLSREKARWNHNIEALEKREQTLVGDALLSSAIVEYLGTFTMSYREGCILYWRLAMSKCKVAVVLLVGYTLRCVALSCASGYTPPSYCYHCRFVFTLK